MDSSNRSAPAFHNNDLVVLAAIAAVFTGALIYGGIYDAFGLSLSIGLVLLGASLATAYTSKSGSGSRILLPALGMAMVGLLIHVARGHSEAHFAVFAFMGLGGAHRQGKGKGQQCLVHVASSWLSGLCSVSGLDAGARERV